ncbi:MAG: hypothetical protein WB509_12670, partial [Acetobacteraceae bacterium]
FGLAGKRLSPSLSDRSILPKVYAGARQFSGMHIPCGGCHWIESLPSIGHTLRLQPLQSLEPTRSIPVQLL